MSGLPVRRTRVQDTLGFVHLPLKGLSQGISAHRENRELLDIV